MAGKRKTKAETAGPGGGVATLAPAAGATQAPTTRSGDLEVTYATIPLIDIAESPHNPRKHFDAGALEELAASIREQGIWEPLLVRPHPAQADIYELASGHRRFRAAKLAGLEQVPCIVRPLDDATFLEVLTVANLQREDVHPLEETDGYVEMMKSLGWDVPTIAKKVGKGETYIYDRLKFQVLIPPIRELFFAGRITPAHAIELSRLTASQQQDAIDPNGSALWRGEQAYDRQQLEIAEADATDPYRGRTVRTVRELRAWVQRHTRFDVREADPVLFPSVTAVADAESKKVKVYEITHSTHIHDDAKASGVKTLTPTFWRRADGTDDAPRCEHSEAALGVIVEGDGRGVAFAICLARETCKVHWSDHMKEKARRVRERERAADAGTDGRASAPVARKRDPAEILDQLRRERFEVLYDEHEVALHRALVDAIVDAPIKAIGAQVLEILDNHFGGLNDEEQALLARIKGADPAAHLRRAFVRSLLGDYDMFSSYGLRARLPEELKPLGIDVPKLIAGVLPATCQYCGCDEQHACEFAAGEGCSWVSKKPPVCSNPLCVAAHEGAQNKGTKGRAKKKAKART